MSLTVIPETAANSIATPRSRSPLRAALDAMIGRTSIVKSPPTTRDVSPPPATHLDTTAVITKIKTVEEKRKKKSRQQEETTSSNRQHQQNNNLKKKIITLKLNSSSRDDRRSSIVAMKRGTELRLSNRRCRIEYDPNASGHMKVITIPEGAFQVVSTNPSAGTMKIIVERDEMSPDSMKAFLFQEAVVGSHFKLAAAESE